MSLPPDSPISAYQTGNLMTNAERSFGLFGGRLPTYPQMDLLHGGPVETKAASEPEWKQLELFESRVICHPLESSAARTCQVLVVVAFDAPKLRRSPAQI
jgi:hypothetical protein